MSILRRATVEDEQLLLALIAEFYQVDGHDYDEAKLSAALPALLKDDCHGVIWMIGEPEIGYAVVTWSYSLESGGRDALLDEIYLRERGSGLGSRALRAILDDCLERGLSRMFLETERHNARVRDFYARAGFTEEDSIWMVWEANA